MLVQRIVDCRCSGYVEVVLFLEPEENADMRFLSVDQVVMSLREKDQVLMTFSYSRVKRDVAASVVLVVCHFLMFFLKIFAIFCHSVRWNLPLT